MENRTRQLTEREAEELRYAVQAAIESRLRKDFWTQPMMLRREIERKWAAMQHDYFELRVKHKLGSYPDDMVMETAAGIERMIFAGERVTERELAWFVEAAARAQPRVVHAVMSDTTQLLEVVG